MKKIVHKPAAPLYAAAAVWVLYALLLGLLTALFRVVGKTPEGVSYAIILGNIAAPLLERLTLPKPFGSQEAIR